MKNLEYLRIMEEKFKDKDITLDEFIEVCDNLKLVVFAVEEESVSIGEGRRKDTKTANSYCSLSEYRAKLKRYFPSWNQEKEKANPYRNKRPTFKLNAQEIKTGDFSLYEDLGGAEVYWNFTVLKNCVVIDYDFWTVD